MKLYRLLDHFPGARRDFDRKLGVVLFLAACAPVAAYAGAKAALGGAIETGFLLTVLCLSLVTAVCAYLGVRMVLAPLADVEAAMRRHLAPNGSMPLPTHYEDMLGRIMRDAEHLAQRAERASQHIQRQADVDDLTGFYTRRAAKRRMVEDCARVDRGVMTLHYALFTLSDLEELGAQHGAATADCLLQHVAKIAELNVRKTDWIARWDERLFAVGFCDNAKAEETIRRMIGVLRQSPMSLGGRTYQARPLCGVAQYLAGTGPKALFKSANHALKAARAGLALPDAPGYVLSQVRPDVEPDLSDFF